MAAFINDIVQRLVYVSYFETNVNLRDAKYTRDTFNQDFERIQPQLIILRNEFLTLKDKVDGIVTMFNDKVPYPKIAKYANHSEGFVITAHIYYLFRYQESCFDYTLVVLFVLCLHKCILYVVRRKRP